MNSPGRKSLLIGPGRLNLVHVEPDGLMYNSAVVISDGEMKRALILFVSWRMVAVIGVTKSWFGSSRPGKTRRMVSVSSFTGGGDSGITVDDSWGWNRVVCCLRICFVRGCLCRIALKIFIVRFLCCLYPFRRVDFW